VIRYQFFSTPRDTDISPQLIRLQESIDTLKGLLAESKNIYANFKNTYESKLQELGKEKTLFSFSCPRKKTKMLQREIKELERHVDYYKNEEIPRLEEALQERQQTLALVRQEASSVSDILGDFTLSREDGDRACQSAYAA